VTSRRSTNLTIELRLLPLLGTGFGAAGERPPLALR
jgi:hypothetical protein